MDEAVYSDSGNGQRHFSFWVAVSFTVNYIVGTGFLTLPWYTIYLIYSTCTYLIL